MHIADNVLPASVWIGGYVVTGVATGCVLARIRDADIPRCAVMTSLFFTVSLVPIPLPMGSIHLILNGLAGIVLGWLVVPAVLIALGFQLLLFGAGGLTTLGINASNIAAGALVARYIFAARVLFAPSRRRELTAGVLAGATALLVSALLFFVCLLSAGERFHEAAKFAFLLHLPLLVIEAVVTASAVVFLARVRPGLLEGSSA